MADSTAIQWNKVVATGLQKRVLPTSSRFRHSDDLRMSNKTIFTSDDFNSQLLARKAASILQKTVAPGSILFAFPPKLFSIHTDYYKQIEQQIGTAQGFLPISHYNNKASKEFLLQVKFTDPALSAKAVETGVNIQNVTYKASASSANASARFVRVHFTLLDIPNEDTLVNDLLSSLKYYGRVHQIRKLYCNEHFENQFTVLIDTSVGYTTNQDEPHSVQPLSRNLYMETWNCYVPASFRGAQPVCYFCTKEGHVKNNCPTLAKTECYRCQQKGHTSRHCTKNESEAQYEENSESDQLDHYKKLQAKRDTKEKQTGSNPVDPQHPVIPPLFKGGQDLVNNSKPSDPKVITVDEDQEMKEQDKDSSPKVITVEEDQEMREQNNDSSPKVTPASRGKEFNPNFQGGSVDSKFASVEVASNMDTDSNPPIAPPRSNGLRPVKTASKKSPKAGRRSKSIDSPRGL